MSFMDTLKAQRHNVRDYGMYIAFVAIVVFFAIATKGLFLTSRNIGNLVLSLIHISEPTRLKTRSRMPSSA